MILGWVPYLVRCLSSILVDRTARQLYEVIVATFGHVGAGKAREKRRDERARNTVQATGR